MADEHDPRMDAGEAARALAAVAETRSRFAQRAHWSLPRHLAVGLLMGLLVASYALPEAGTMAVLGLVILLVLLVIARDRARDGFFVNGYRKGRTRTIALLLAGASILALGAALAGKHLYGMGWAPIAAGAIMVAAGTWASIAWERAYRADLAGRA